jgi:hypothetical protein
MDFGKIAGDIFTGNIGGAINDAVNGDSNGPDPSQCQTSAADAQSYVQGELAGLGQVLQSGCAQLMQALQSLAQEVGIDVSSAPGVTVGPPPPAYPGVTVAPPAPDAPGVTISAPPPAAPGVTIVPPPPPG